MVFSISKIALAAACLSSLGVNAAAPIRQRNFVIQVASDSASLDGSYVIAQKRSPTYGTVLDLSEDSATPFYLGHHGGIRTPLNGGRPRFAEQTAGEDDSRVYFATVPYGKEVGSGFDNLTCSYGPPIEKGEKPLTCTSGPRTGIYGCTGTGEGSGLFLYNVANPPEGPTSDPEDCAIITSLTAIKVELVKSSVAIVEV